MSKIEKQFQFLGNTVYVRQFNETRYDVQLSGEKSFFLWLFFFFFRISSEAMTELSEVDFSKLEGFAILLYDPYSTSLTANECRRNPFTQKARSTEEIPPTSGALFQHVKRAPL